MPEPELTKYEELSDISFLRRIESWAAHCGWVVTQAGAYSCVLLAPEWARSRVPSYLVQVAECNTAEDAHRTQAIFESAQRDFPNDRWESALWTQQEWQAISTALELRGIAPPPLKLVELKTDA